MTQHRLIPKLPGHTCVVGWDVPLQTYFAIVSRDTDDDEEDNLVLWVGGKPQECRSPSDLIAPLKPYADLTPTMAAQLKADRAAAPKPTQLQRQMIRVFGEGRGR